MNEYYDDEFQSIRQRDRHESARNAILTCGALAVTEITAIRADLPELAEKIGTLGKQLSSVAESLTDQSAIDDAISESLEDPIPRNAHIALGMFHLLKVFADGLENQFHYSSLPPRARRQLIESIAAIRELADEAFEQANHGGRFDGLKGDESEDWK